MLFFREPLKLRRIIRDGVTLQKIRADIGETVYQRRLNLLKNRLEKILKWKNPNPILLEIIKKVRRQKNYILTNQNTCLYHNQYAHIFLKHNL